MSDVAADPIASYSQPYWSTESRPSKAVYTPHNIDYISRFEKLVKLWRQETALSSLVAEKIDHPAFKEIVGMGESAISLIINELKQKPDFLFIALELITDESQVPQAYAGQIDKIVDAWLSWAERNKQNAG